MNAPRICAAPSPESSPATSRNTAVNAIERYGPFELAGEPAIMEPLDRLLRSFVAQGRMKFTGAEYKPCYRLVA